jgi:hypothetical protein
MATDMDRVASGEVCVDIALRYQIEPFSVLPSCMIIAFALAFSEEQAIPTIRAWMVSLDFSGPAVPRRVLSKCRWLLFFQHII